MNSAKLVIPCTLPGLNEYIAAERTHRQIAAKMKREAERVIGLAIRVQLHGVKFERPVFLHYLWVERDRRRDKDNIDFAKKFIQDALVRAKVLPNDGWKNIENWKSEFTVDKQRPRVEVEIREAQK